MRRIHYIIPSATFLVTLLLSQWERKDQRQGATEPDGDAISGHQSSLTTRHLVDQSLAPQGMLWETAATAEGKRVSRSIEVRADSFSEALEGQIGEPVVLRFSSEFPSPRAEVTGRSSECDGTRFTHLRIPGAPEGWLTIQENEAMDFFLAQLYYEEHPVAYEFKKSGRELIATRHEVSELICSLVDHKQGTVEQMGLPPVDKIRGKKSDEDNQSAIENARKLLQEARPGGSTGGGDTTIPSLGVADVAISEGNSGLKDLVFTVRLSKADRKKTIAVDFSTADGSALAGSDYTGISGTVSIPAGRTSATFNVPVAGDTVIEGDETFAVNLTRPVNAVIGDALAVGTIANDDSPPSAVPVFNSLPGAVAVAYLDMDGQVVSGTQWAGGATIAARGVVGSLTNAQMIEICRRTAEDYSPFEINVTTEESVYLAAPSNRRIRCIITPDNEWYGSAGGVAYLNSFTWTGDTPCWVFSDMLANSPRYIAEATSHEIGHTLTLRHDGRLSPSEAYYEGHGSGEVGWAPIMGVGYYRLLVQWSKGEYLSADNLEDDLARITTLNGFGYRADQAGNTTGTAVPLGGTSGARNAAGILEVTGDADVYRFTTAGGSCAFTAAGDATSQNLDLRVEILGGDGSVVASANPDTLTDASVSVVLAAGDYFLRVSGPGRGDVLADGYSNYGSTGQYTISGDAP
jgi:Calx-beta domain